MSWPSWIYALDYARAATHAIATLRGSGARRRLWIRAANRQLHWRLYPPDRQGPPGYYLGLWLNGRAPVRPVAEAMLIAVELHHDSRGEPAPGSQERQEIELELERLRAKAGPVTPERFKDLINAMSKRSTS